jgi:hypothetical protein
MRMNVIIFLLIVTGSGFFAYSQLSSNLPIVVITTPNGEEIPDEPKITADMKIIYNGIGQLNTLNDSGNIYSGKVGIEIRGRTSTLLPQKSYGFETRDDAGNNLNVPILGMPDENDWILTANYNDKTFLRNFLAFELFRKMGHYAPHTVYCEVVLNGEYMGIYLLGEKIKQDKNRVNIAKLNPDENSGDDLTGGYIFSNDYTDGSDSWISNYSPLNKPGSEVFFVYCDPKPEDLTTTQKAYLKDFIDSVETLLYSPGFKDRNQGYRTYLDAVSFVDYFILSELSRNVDAYKKSRFYFKDKDSKGRLIHSGPPWDYDWAWKDVAENCIHFNQIDGSGWAYRVNDCDVDWVAPSWEIRLLEDDEFADQIYERYFSLRRTILGETYLHHVIDSIAALLDDAQNRHYQKWQILGINVGTPEYGEQPETYSGEIVKFKNWINRRLNWLDENMVGDSAAFLTIDSTKTSNFICFGENNGNVCVYPSGGTFPYAYTIIPGDSSNSTGCFVNLPAGNYTVEVTDANSRSVTIDQLTINQLNPIIFNTAVTNVSCNGGSDGSITSYGMGGDAYLYNCLWDDGETTCDRSDLPAGSYTLIVTYDNGCTKDSTFIISEPAVLEITNVDTFWNTALQVGRINFTASGGTEPYIYKLSGGNDHPYDTITNYNEGNFSGLAGGTYTIIVVDNNKCADSVDSTEVLESGHVSMQKLFAETGISLYPNPTTGKLTVEIEARNHQDINIEILNMLGQVIWKKYLQNIGEPRYVEVIDISKYSKGTYFMRVNGLPIHTKILLE